MSSTTKPALPDEFGNPWMSNLEEITLPEPIAWTPQTIGWLLLAVALLLFVGWLAWRLVRRWRANAYRREALDRIGEIDGSLQDVAARSRALRELPELIKRVALAAYPRTDVARLSGEAWLGFLDGAIGTTQFTRGPGRALPGLAYDPAAAASMTEPEAKALLKLVRSWTRKHRSSAT